MIGILENNMNYQRKFILLVIVMLFIVYSYFIIINELYICTLNIYSLSTQYRNYQYQAPLIIQLIKNYFVKNTINVIFLLYSIKIYDLKNNNRYIYFREFKLISYINKRKMLLLLSHFNGSRYKDSFQFKEYL